MTLLPEDLEWMRTAQSEVMSSYGVALIRGVVNDGAGGETQAFVANPTPFRCSLDAASSNAVTNADQRKTDTSTQTLSVEYGAPDMTYQDRVLIDNAYTYEIVSRLAGRADSLSTVDTYAVVAL